MLSMVILDILDINLSNISPKLLGACLGLGALDKLRGKEEKLSMAILA